MTISIRRRMTQGFYFRLAYTYAHAIDDGQDALIAGSPALVQNSYNTSAEKGPSVTDQRHRLVISWIAEPRPFDRSRPILSKLFNSWKLSGVISGGSGRPVDAKVFGDPNRDGNSSNDRLPGAGRNSFVGPNYATADMRISRRLFKNDRFKLELQVEAFNMLNRDNQRVQITDNGFQTSGTQFVQTDKTIGINHFPGYYQTPANLMRATDAYAARQIQLALRLNY